MKNTMKTISAFALVAALSIVAFAAVTFDAGTGTGFVGKGDVAAVLGGLNNAQMNALVAEFTYSDSVEYDVPCMKDNGRQVLRNTYDRKSTVNSDVTFEYRKNGQGNLTGYTLNGFGDRIIDGEIACPGGWEADGEPLLVGSSGGVLSVNGVPLQ